MNNRITELIERADRKFVRNGINLIEVIDQEKFAEAIINECLTHINDRHLCDEIRNSFGIVNKAEL